MAERKTGLHIQGNKGGKERLDGVTALCEGVQVACIVAILMHIVRHERVDVRTSTENNVGGGRQYILFICVVCPFLVGGRLDAHNFTQVNREDDTAELLSAEAMTVLHFATADVTLANTGAIVNGVSIRIGIHIGVRNVQLCCSVTVTGSLSTVRFHFAVTLLRRRGDAGSLCVGTCVRYGRGVRALFKFGGDDGGGGAASGSRVSVSARVSVGVGAVPVCRRVRGWRAATTTSRLEEVAFRGGNELLPDDDNLFVRVCRLRPLNTADRRWPSILILYIQHSAILSSWEWTADSGNEW